MDKLQQIKITKRTPIKQTILKASTPNVIHNSEGNNQILIVKKKQID